jgi:hypothetical protein
LPFQGLEEISASLTENKAVATVSAFEETKSYTLHPVTMDQCLQVLLVAAYKGQGREVKGFPIVTGIDRLVVSTGKWDKLRIECTATENGSGNLTGDVSAVSDSGVSILSVNCCKTSVLSTTNKLFSFVKWDTDAIHSNLNRGLAPFNPQLDPSILLERLSLLHILDIGGSDGAIGQVHLQKIQDAVASKPHGRFGIIDDISPFVELDPSSRRTLRQLLKEQISNTSIASLGTLIEGILPSGAPFSKGNAERKAMLEQCDPLVRNNGILGNIVKLLAHKNPKLRILELGNGADETARWVLDALGSKDSERLYLTYTYAATSPEALRKAKERFKEVRNIDVVFFDVEKQLQGQSLQAGAYDLIITTDV